MARDLFNNIKLTNALNVGTINSNTTTNGVVIDRQGFDSVTFVLRSGTLTDGDYLPLIEHDDVVGFGTAVAVPDSDLIGTEAGAALTDDADDNKSSKVGYIGRKRYVRLSVVSTNTTSGAIIGGLCILGHPLEGPQGAQETA